MNTLLQSWADAIAVSAAIFIIVVTAVGMMMIGLVDLHQALKHVVPFLDCLVLLLALPPIITGIWHSLLP